MILQMLSLHLWSKAASRLQSLLNIETIRNFKWSYLNSVSLQLYFISLQRHQLWFKNIAAPNYFIVFYYSDEENGNNLVKSSSSIIRSEKYLVDNKMIAYSGLPILVNNFNSTILSISKVTRVSKSATDSPKLQINGA